MPLSMEAYCQFLQTTSVIYSLEQCVQAFRHRNVSVATNRDYVYVEICDESQVLHAESLRRGTAWVGTATLTDDIDNGVNPLAK